MAERNECSFAGFVYPPGSKICKAGKCSKCSDGTWQETGEKCPC